MVFMHCSDDIKHSIINILLGYALRTTDVEFLRSLYIIYVYSTFKGKASTTIYLIPIIHLVLDLLSCVSSYA